MRIEQLGDGEPEIAILAAVHGDEPCGVHAVETLLDESPDVDRPVKFIIANERALEQNVRYTEVDMNRVFPGDRESDIYEYRLAAELLDELRGCTTFSMHSTQSYERPFAIVADVDSLSCAVCPSLSIDAVVEAGDEFPDSLIAHTDRIIEVECGFQGTEQAAMNAEQLVREFLAAMGALPHNEPDVRSIPTYRIEGVIPKLPGEDYSITVQNFEKVEEGKEYATVDGQSLTAEESFYPVLVSEHGYEKQFGYVGKLSGAIVDGKSTMKARMGR